MKKILYICSVVLPLYDILVGTYKGFKKGLKLAGNERFHKEQEMRYKAIKSQL